MSLELRVRDVARTLEELLDSTREQSLAQVAQALLESGAVGLAAECMDDVAASGRDSREVRMAEALLSWAESCCGLTRSGTIGAEVTIPADRLARFEFPAGWEPPAGAVVRARLLRPGWRRNGKAIQNPAVEPLTE